MHAKFNTEDLDNPSKNESNYSLTLLVKTTCKSQKDNKIMCVLMLTHNIPFYNNEDFG